ncbi:MAG: T9SS type A sorting domain-containing protein [Bacteroidota bacterium]
MQSRTSFLIIFITIILNQIGLTQSIWPGDVNNNGVVNKVDLLYLGYAFGETGPPRAAEDSTWNAQSLPQDWAGNFPNGLNYLYADCNGDGIVNELDADIIKAHIGLSHDDVLFEPDVPLSGMQGVNPACRFINPPAVAPVDQLFDLEIGLGDLEIPVENMSGFTFFINVDPAIIGLNNTAFTFDNATFLDGGEDISIAAQRRDLDQVRLEVAYTKTDRVPVSGFGSIGKVSFILETDVIDLLVIDTVTFTIDSIIVLDDELTPIPVAADTLKLFIDRALKVNTNDHYPTPNQVEVYPNPNNGLLLVEAPMKNLEFAEIINTLGQIEWRQPLAKVDFQHLNLQTLQAGVYWLKLYTEQGTVTKKIQKL